MMTRRAIWIILCTIWEYKARVVFFKSLKSQNTKIDANKSDSLSKYIIKYTGKILITNIKDRVGGYLQVDSSFACA